MSDLFSILARQEYIEYIDFSQYYREKKLLERVEINYEREIQSLELILSQSNKICLVLRDELTNIKKSQRL